MNKPKTSKTPPKSQKAAPSSPPRPGLKSRLKINEPFEILDNPPPFVYNNKRSDINTKLLTTFATMQDGKWFILPKKDFTVFFGKRAPSSIAQHITQLGRKYCKEHATNSTIRTRLLDDGSIGIGRVVKGSHGY